MENFSMPLLAASKTSHNNLKLVKNSKLRKCRKILPLSRKQFWPFFSVISSPIELKIFWGWDFKRFGLDGFVLFLDIFYQSRLAGFKNLSTPETLEILRTAQYSGSPAWSIWNFQKQKMSAPIESVYP